MIVTKKNNIRAQQAEMILGAVGKAANDMQWAKKQISRLSQAAKERAERRQAS